MSAQGVAVLLSWMSCCGSALWRYYTNSPNYHIFSTRSTIKLEYEGTAFSEWSVPATCSVKNKKSPKTELRCSSPGVHTIKPIVTGPDLEEERYLSVDSSHTCFLWYYKVRNFIHNLTQVLTIWIYDPENADPNELLRNANEPSLNSIVLSKQLASWGQRPAIYTFLKRKAYFPHGKMNGTWRISIPLVADDALKEIKGNKVAFQDCFIEDYLFLLTFPLLTIPEIPGFLPITSPQGSQLMADWIACLPSAIVVVADMETFHTNDSFRTWTRLRVPPNVLTDDERHNVSDVNLSLNGVFFLINGIVYLKSLTAFTRLGNNENLPEGGIIGLASRKWCWSKYRLKANIKSTMAIWTSDEIYLRYASPKFVKLITIKKLKKILNMSAAAVVTIHKVEYTGHPLELAVLLNYCITCTAFKKMYIVIYSEVTEQWMLQDFVLNVTIDSVITSRFLYTAMSELILWDKHRVYYCYHNFTVTGVVQTPTEFGNLSRLSHDSVINTVFTDYYGNIIVKMENNVMFFFKTYTTDAIKLHLWINSQTKSLFFLNASGKIYLIYVFDDGTIYPQDYPLRLEIQSIGSRSKSTECPFIVFYHNILYISYVLDKGHHLSFWAQIVYPENAGLYITMESYGPNILEEKSQVLYEIASGYCTKTMTVTFFQTENYEAVNDYFKLQQQNTGLLIVRVRPSEYTKMCPAAQKVFQVAVGCDFSKFIAIKGFNRKKCRWHDFFYIIQKSYLRNQPSKNLRVKYNWKKYGCPLRLNFREKFHPVVQLYNDDGYIEDVDVNFIVWEIHGRNDYSFNNTMKTSGCLNEAQTWKSMHELNKHLPLEDAWGPENYKHCFSYAVGKPGDLNQPYEIINKSNYNHLVWPMQHTGMYVFRVKILDPNYSFCNLTAIFAIEIYGMISSPNGDLVIAFLFLLMLLFFSILVLSYFHYMRIYRQYIYAPIHKTKRKQQKNNM
ncbi:cation channel sperm-associated protein subunit epsilon [Pteropus vampyrus]|uniref:Cation channel sperm-associated protein subunit epsilon n=1 Tax=Pteropus vampyrus TaxID=132908 RepID=A0A6P3QY96_PTEVA|nr:cation channel sperm-associated protein subunit epsilon [Pteropus vampyrus]